MKHTKTIRRLLEASELILECYHDKYNIRFSTMPYLILDIKGRRLTDNEIEGRWNKLKQAIAAAREE